MSFSSLAYGSNQPLVTFDSSGGFARLVVFQKDQVLAWGKAAMPGRQEVSEAGEATINADLLEQLRILLHELAPREGLAVASLPASMCLMRRVQLPKMQHKYFRQVALAEIMESVPLAKADVDIVWRRANADATPQVFAAVAPKAALDHHINLVKSVGLRLRAAYPRQMALAMAAGFQNGICVETIGPAVEVVLVKDGFPAAVHQYEVRDSGSKNQADIVASLAMTITEMAALAEDPSMHTASGPLPLALLEDVPPDDSLANPLGRALGQQIHIFRPPFRYPEHFPAQEYAVNMGLALAYQHKASAWIRRSSTRSMALDLLPLRHKPRPFPWTQVGAGAVLLLAVYLALPLTGQVQTMSHEADQLKASVTSLEASVRARDMAAARTDLARTRLEEAFMYQAALETRLEGLQDDTEKVQARLQSIVSSAKTLGLGLSSVTSEANAFLINGVSPSGDGLLLFTEALRSQGFFKSVHVIQLQTLGGSEGAGIFTTPGSVPVSFRVKAEVDPPTSVHAQPAKNVLNLLQGVTGQAGTAPPSR